MDKTWLTIWRLNREHCERRKRYGKKYFLQVKCHSDVKILNKLIGWMPVIAGKTMLE